MDIKQNIIEFSKTIGIEAIGFCKAESDEQQLWIAGQSFIVILQSYSLNIEQGASGELLGTVSRASIFEDYHTIVNEKLRHLKEYLEKKFSVQSLSYCDRSPFSDRVLAVRAGLGVIGKNSFLMNQKFGTSVFIGYLLTDFDFQEYDVRVEEDLCGSCTNCIKACPNQAILSKRQINANRCISYLTQTKVIEEGFREKMNRSLYGCDICQLACPYNIGTTNQVFEKIVSPNFSLEELLNINNETFKKTFGKTASGWRGKKTLQRNAIIALSTYKTDESVGILRQHILDSREDIRLEIVQALSTIGTEAANEVLQELLRIEKNEAIRKEIKTYGILEF